MLAVAFMLTSHLWGQTNPNFQVHLDIDYASAEQTLDLYQDRFVSTENLASLRGNQIASATAGMIAHNGSVTSQFKEYLDSIKEHLHLQSDVYHMEAARARSAEIAALLGIIKKENFSDKVTATVEQIFPSNAKIEASIPLYFVALGHQNVDAFVRRIVWQGNTPQFVGEHQGDLTIVVNLAKAVDYPGNTQQKFVQMLFVVSHEVFHAAFGVYKDGSAVWRAYMASHQSAFDQLLDLTQNEGIAYYLSLNQAGKGYLPPDWDMHMRAELATFNTNAGELLAKDVTPQRASELIRTANLSGYWESYGAMAGMFIAREIDKESGRAALIETIEKGPADFFNKYAALTQRNNNLPPLSTEIQTAVQ
jgi:hypothetical protein